MGVEVEELAEDSEVGLPALVELAEDRGRPVSHYLAAAALQDVRITPPPGATLTVKVCAGTCQRWGALDLLDHLASKIIPEQRNAIGGKAIALQPVSCLDRCDQAPACELHGPHGQLVLAPATTAALDEALTQL